MKYYVEKSVLNDCGSDFVLQDKMEDVDFYQNISREIKIFKPNSFSYIIFT